MKPAPPTTETELQDRLEAIAGKRVVDIANELGLPVPADLRRHKGWLGELVEQALGCDAASLSEPDFTALGIELKTLPLNSNGRVQESTYVCTVPLSGAGQLQWQDSCVYRKLCRVLWLPVEADSNIPLAERHIGAGLLWEASTQELAALQQDWEEHMAQVTLGQFESISASHGEILQVRPKAANSRVLVDATGPDGQPMKTLPRGFYLRSNFTNSILERYFLSSAGGL